MSSPVQSYGVLHVGQNQLVNFILCCGGNTYRQSVARDPVNLRQFFEAYVLPPHDELSLSSISQVMQSCRKFFKGKRHPLIDCDASQALTLQS